MYFLLHLKGQVRGSIGLVISKAVSTTIIHHSRQKAFFSAAGNLDFGVVIQNNGATFSFFVLFYIFQMIRCD